MPYSDKEKQKEYVSKWGQRHKKERRTEAALRMAALRAKDPEKYRNYQKEWRKEHCESHSEYMRNYFREYYKRPGVLERKRQLASIRWKELKQEVFTAYGSKCACCGEAESLFLSIDHVFNDGSRHTKELFGNKHSSVRFYYWLKRSGYPKDRFQLLCMNCNWGKAHNDGICPHKTKES